MLLLCRVYIIHIQIDGRDVEKYYMLITTSQLFLQIIKIKVNLSLIK